MAGIRSIVASNGDESASLRKAIPGFLELYPTVGEMLCGAPAKGDEPAISKFFLSFRLESDGLVVKCSQEGVDTDLYVKVEDSLTAWACLETALTQGRFTRRRRKRTDVPY